MKVEYVNGTRVVTGAVMCDSRHAMPINGHAPRYVLRPTAAKVWDGHMAPAPVAGRGTARRIWGDA